MSWKKLSLALLSLAVLVAAVFGMVWAVPILKVENIEVSGTRHLPEEEVREVSGIATEENMLRVNVAAAASAVADSPWVKAVSVRRNWPATISIDVTERNAVLFTDTAEGIKLIDESGVPFLIGEPPAETVEVTGDANDDTAELVEVAEVVAAVDPAVREQVARVEVPSALEITFHLHDGRSVYWGANRDNHDKALAMETVLSREGQHWNISNPTMVTVR
ncbi:Cell division protein FtsQ [Corynebacterium occultum]|uniref:Cell division protein FtsQ n=1 Tax=Corynebacterium occultum TaxID=2675219 RepID=A0A6B8W2S5_9CORY|nr:FtsQ-type POTRA domain-containing protein [Corynebacterium occultum]QGU07804.1 Cell division protein FtsQ [Corynebacterium occultum]